MPYNAVYSSLRFVHTKYLQWMLWFIIFFVGVNGVVWYVFDYQFHEYVHFTRMLNEPSENEVQTMLSELQQDSATERIIVVGDSVVAGVGLQEQVLFTTLLEENMQSISVVNLAAPAESFLDEYAIIQQIWNPQDTYVFFINPIWFQRESRILFPTVLSRARGETPSLHMTAQAVLRKIVPLYRNRDVLNKHVFGIHPSSAVRVILGRLRARFTTEPLQESVLSDQQQEGGELQSITVHPEFARLQEVQRAFAQKNNVYFVLLDDAWFDHTETQRQSMQQLEKMLGDRVLNLHHTFDASLFLDRTHLNTAGHTHLMTTLYDFLHAS